MSRATNDAFDALHGLMAEGMTEELRRGLERAAAPRLIADPDDPTKQIVNPEYVPLSNQLLVAIRAFLKDNGIDAPAQSKRFDGLTAQLRDLDLDDPSNHPLQ